MYDVLAYVFENCQRTEIAQDTDAVAKKLSAAGFDDGDIVEALRWLAGLTDSPHDGLDKLPDPSRTFRAYAPRELAKLDAACRGFLLTLEQSGVLDPRMRELIIERSLAANGDALTLDQLKLVVLMVLWSNQTPARQLVAEDVFNPGKARIPN